MTGIVTKNGTLAEGYTYDAYGKVNVWGYPPMDFNRDGDVDNDDLAEFTSADASPDPAVDPKADADGDGDVDGADYSYFQAVATAPDVPPVTLFTSGLGNVYFFTGRRLHFHETLHDDPDPANPEPNRQVQYSRARHYCPIHGRFLQQDPAEYVDGMNLYEYVSSRPTVLTDPTGKWEENVHKYKTSQWAQEVGMKKDAASYVGQANIDTDGGGVFHGDGTGFTIGLLGGDQSRHFNRSRGPGDTRLQWVNIEYNEAVRFCAQGSNQSASPRDAARHLGQALHSLQDWWAHGDYSKGPYDIVFPHLSKYDVWGMDAVGEYHGVIAHPNGRAPQVFDIAPMSMKKEEIRWGSWGYGTLRATGTATESRNLTTNFLNVIRTRGFKKCKCYFLK